MYYGCQTSLGLKMPVSIDFLLLELVISFQHFHVSCTRHGEWVMMCWFKPILGEVALFGIQLEVNNVPLKFARTRDKWLMTEYVWVSYDSQDLLWLKELESSHKSYFVRCTGCWW